MSFRPCLLLTLLAFAAHGAGQTPPSSPLDLAPPPPARLRHDARARADGLGGSGDGLLHRPDTYGADAPRRGRPEHRAGHLPGRRKPRAGCRAGRFVHLTPSDHSAHAAIAKPFKNLLG